MNLRLVEDVFGGTVKRDDHPGEELVMMTQARK